MATSITTEQLAKHLGVTPRRINQYVQEGLPKLNRNRFDIDKCCQWVQEYREREWQARIIEVGGAHERYYEAQARRTDINAERDHDKLFRDRGELIHVNDIAPFLNRAYASVKAQLLALETQLINKVGVDHARIVGAEQRRVLSELAKESERIKNLWQPKSASGTIHDRSAMPTAKTRPKRVGRTKPLSQPRNKSG